MDLEELNDHELTQILDRAQELTRKGRDLLEPGEAYSAYLDAAQEMGIPREAVLQALCERLQVPVEPIRQGSRSFAKGADNAFYAAEILTIDKLNATVRFANGSEHTCSVTDLRPFALLPGRGFEAFYQPWAQWIPATVQKYSEECRLAQVTFFDGEHATLPLHEIRLPAETLSAKARGAYFRSLRMAIYLTALAATLALAYQLFYR